MTRVRLASPVLALAAFAALLPGCTQNAALEVEMRVAGQGESDKPFVVVQVRDASEFPFDVEWQGADPGFALDSDSNVLALSVLAESEPKAVHLKLRFCDERNCSAPGDDLAPELWFRLESPIYVGERTFWEPEELILQPDARPMPPEPITDDNVCMFATCVDKCDIEGCVANDSVTGYCRMDDGSHFCEGD